MVEMSPPGGHLKSSGSTQRLTEGGAIASITFILLFYLIIVILKCGFLVNEVRRQNIKKIQENKSALPVVGVLPSPTSPLYPPRPLQVDLFLVAGQMPSCPGSSLLPFDSFMTPRPHGNGAV